MIAAVSALNASEQQLQQAIETATAQIEIQYQTALQNYKKAQAALAAQETDSLRLDRYGLEYSNLERDYLENEKILDQILSSQLQEQQSSSGTLENETARIVDRAEPPRKASYPNYSLNFSLAITAGICIGLGLAFFVAFNDDRIKSAFDIESVVGLPLLGIVPLAPKSGGGRHARGVPEVQEAYSSILSALQLKEEGKKAQCILITSTIAGEGKTFISTSLAETYASHGEHVVVVDCDLRRPAVNRAFNLENLKGVIDVCTAGASLDESIIKDVRPRLDVLPTGGRSNNPSQLLNGKEFAQMLSDLRKRYDRIIVDTPPAGIVSDAFIILPMMDGSIYSIFFNKVRRKAAQFCAQRLLEVNTPQFGAILNGLKAGIGGYYYAQYYGRRYKDYYVARPTSQNGSAHKVPEDIKHPLRGRRS
jgi:capsular exopolysaccharide synthesis family protein